jgi:paraquat-inducible protein A
MTGEHEPDTSLPMTLRACPGCGLLHTVPQSTQRMTAYCVRCPTPVLRVTGRAPDDDMALTIAALVLLLVMCSTTLMTVQTSGMIHSADLLSGPAELVRRDMWPLALVVVFVTLVAPFAKLGGTLYVLVRLRLPSPPAHLRRVFAIAETLRPWTMIEVFVFGVFVAYVKLGDLVHITLDVGVYALLALTIVLVWADSAIDRERVWRQLDHDSSTLRPVATVDHAHAIACETCGLVSVVPPGEVHHCPRCGSHLHARKSDSISRTWALVVAAAVMYVPANYFPVLTVVQLGAGSPSTIIGGVEELVASRLYPLAALVFFASIAVPMLKLISLTFMLIMTQIGRAEWLHDRTRLYHVVRWIGRWSMIDIFMEALLGALVKFGNVVTIEPGIGALAFCAVVILTMFAAESFDPRLMWDVSTERSPALGSA